MSRYPTPLANYPRTVTARHNYSMSTPVVTRNADAAGQERAPAERPKVGEDIAATMRQEVELHRRGVPQDGRGRHFRRGRPGRANRWGGDTDVTRRLAPHLV